MITRFLMNSWYYLIIEIPMRRSGEDPSPWGRSLLSFSVLRMKTIKTCIISDGSLITWKSEMPLMILGALPISSLPNTFCYPFPSGGRGRGYVRLWAWYISIKMLWPLRNWHLRCHSLCTFFPWVLRPLWHPDTTARQLPNFHKCINLLL